MFLEPLLSHPLMLWLNSLWLSSIGPPHCLLTPLQPQDPCLFREKTCRHRLLLKPFLRWDILPRDLHGQLLNLPVRSNSPSRWGWPWLCLVKQTCHSSSIPSPLPHPACIPFLKHTSISTILCHVLIYYVYCYCLPIFHCDVCSMRQTYLILLFTGVSSAPRAVMCLQQVASICLIMSTAYENRNIRVKVETIFNNLFKIHFKNSKLKNILKHMKSTEKGIVAL